MGDRVELRGRGRRLETESLARRASTSGRWRNTCRGARKLAMRSPSSAEEASRPVEPERLPSQLEPKGRRLGVDSVGAADAEGVAVLLGPADDREKRSAAGPRARRLPPPARSATAPCRRIGRSEPVTEPPPLGAQSFRDGIDECCDVVVVSRSISATRSGVARRPARVSLPRSRRKSRRPATDLERRQLQRASAAAPPSSDADAGRSRTGAAGDHAA